MSKSVPLTAIQSRAHEFGQSLTRQQELASALESGQVFWLQGMIEAMSPIFRKMSTSPEKSHNGKNFQNLDFHFKIRFGPFSIDFDQKKSTKNFCLCHFFDL